MRTYKVLPLNHLSRAWGWLADAHLPPPLDYFSVWAFAKLAKCDRQEAEFDCLTQYKTISQFFRRRLKAGVRPICNNSSVVSPADGRLTFVGAVDGPFLQQVKGISYCINQFLGGLEDIANICVVTKPNIQYTDKIDQSGKITINQEMEYCKR